MASNTASTQKPDPPRIEGVWLGASLALLAAALLMPSIRGMDGAGNYVYLMSILNDGDLDFANDYAALDFQGRNDFKFEEECPRDPATGLPANRYGVGAAIFWAPGVFTVDAVMRMAAPERADGISRPYEWAVAIGSAFWGSLGIWLLYNRLREGLGRLASATASAGILFATPLGFYMYAHGSMSHAVSFFISVAAMLTLEKAISAPTRFAPAILGLWCGLLVATRPQDATWAAALGGALFWLWGGAISFRGRESASASAATASIEVLESSVRVRRSALQADSESETVASDRTFENRHSVAGAPADAASISGTAVLGRVSFPYNRFVALALFTLAAAAAFFPQMAAWKILYGSWLSGPAPYLNREAGGFEPLPIHLFDVLFGQRRGLFLWHPILLITLAGLVGRLFKPTTKSASPHASASACKADLRVAGQGLIPKPIAVVALVGLALQIYLVSCWSVWWAGASFGNRFFISSYPWLALGLGSAIASMDRRISRWAAPALVAALMAWNAGLLIQYGAEMIDREETNSWIDIVANQFTEVPEWLIEKISSRL